MELSKTYYLPTLPKEITEASTKEPNYSHFKVTVEEVDLDLPAWWNWNGYYGKWTPVEHSSLKFACIEHFPDPHMPSGFGFHVTVFASKAERDQKRDSLFRAMKDASPDHKRIKLLQELQHLTGSLQV